MALQRDTVTTLVFYLKTVKAPSSCEAACVSWYLSLTSAGFIIMQE